ncbi:hypothetical protein BA065_03275 [Nanoarchaeota archaeon NZ13-N]|nr:MAG: hypothetical protein BA065_03275 [Nanoarchaeota archaeon NZ13-N]
MIINIGIIVGKKYENPKEFLKDFEIEAVTQDSRTMDYVKEIIENARALHVSINLSDEFLSEEVFDKIGDIYERIVKKTNYEIDDDCLNDILDNVEKGLSDTAANRIIDLLKKFRLNKLTLYRPSSPIIPYPINPPNKYRTPIDKRVQKIYTLIKEIKLPYEINIWLLHDFELVLFDNKILRCSPRYKTLKLCDIATPLNEVFTDSPIEDWEFERYREEFERIFEFYKRVNCYLITLLDELDNKIT